MDQHDISQRRVALGMSGAALARELGVAPSTLLRWERGDVTIGPAMTRLVELTLSRLEKDQERRAARRAAYAAARTRQNEDGLQ